jgi:aminoglycoside phosphotransferase (APT) family kinase protein
MFAGILGQWIKTLHTLPIEPIHLARIQGEQDWRLDITQRTERVADSLDRYATYYREAGFDPAHLLELMHSFEQLHISDEQHCYVHSDLYAKHIVVNDNGLPLGFIDWGDVHIGHPGLDLALAFMIFNPSARDVFLDAYQVNDSTILDVAVFKAFYHSILGYPYFCQKHELTTVAWTEAAIHNMVDYMNH